MGIRMSGLISGLDTESLVGALMSAQSLKKTKLVKSKTKLEWKQTKWEELNTKLKNLYNNYVSKMRLASSYSTKKAAVSDPTKANVTASSNAVNGSYSLDIQHIATTQYLSGAKIGAASGSDKLADVDPSLVNKEIEVKVGEKTTKITITADMTLNGFASELRNAGLNASYDATQKRFFVSSKESGVENAFSITSSGLTGAEISGREAVYNAVGYSKMSSANKKKVDEAMSALQTSAVGSDAYNNALDSISKAVYDTKEAAAEEAAKTYVKAKLYADNYDTYKTEAENELRSQFYDDDGNIKGTFAAGDFEMAVAAKAAEKTEAFVNKQISTDDQTKLDIDAAKFAGKSEADINALSEEAKKKYYGTGENGALVIEAFDGTSGYTQDSIKNDLSTPVQDYANITDRNSALAGSALSSLGLADISVAQDGTVTVSGKPDGMALVEASDSKILLNGAELTSSTSTVSANGLSIELTGLTTATGPITFSVSNDVESVYNSVKSFLKEYNSVMKEMQELYGAESAKGYEPLTSEEKKALSDDEVEEWEKKIKDSLLRRDSTLNGIISSMRSAMMSQVTYDGKTYSLASFGIMTSTDYTEGGLLHIYGDADDAVYADKEDKLKKALQDDPEAVMNVLSDVFENLRSVMSQKMAGSKTSSAMTFYNDITMKEQIKTYKKDITRWEDKLADMEEAYYRKFSKMEAAMAKLQSQQNSLAGLFGNG